MITHSARLIEHLAALLDSATGRLPFAIDRYIILDIIS